MNFSLNDLQIFLLIVFRVTGIMFFAPIFASESIPPQLKIGFSFILAAILYSVIPTQVVIPPNLGAYLICVIAELATGALIGFVCAGIFWIVILAGSIIDNEIGFALANVIDPITGEQISIIAQYSFLIGMVAFLALDGHYQVISALHASFINIPIGGLNFPDKLSIFLTDTLFSGIFKNAFKIAAPVMLAVLLSTLALAFMTKAAPQMNIFMIAFSVRVMVGIVMLMIVISAIAYSMERLNLDFAKHLEYVIKLMSGK